MKRMCFLKRACVLLAVLMLLAAWGEVPGAAALDLTRTGSVSLLLKAPEGGEGIPQAEFALYRVAAAQSRDHMLSFVLTEEFAQCGVSTDALMDGDSAKDLAAYAAAEKIQPAAVGKTGEDGSLRFSNLQPGIYLVTQEEGADGYYPAAPFLVSLPYTSGQGDSWEFDVEASPKVELLPTQPVDLTVKKVWRDNGKNRPSSVTVRLLDGSRVVETVVLNAGNSWTHSWEDLDATGNWSVEEYPVPRGYRAAYSSKDDVVTITNTNALLQTGQLNWPVPVLAVAGVLLFAAGWILFFGRKRGTDET